MSENQPEDQPEHQVEEQTEERLEVAETQDADSSGAGSAEEETSVEALQEQLATQAKDLASLQDQMLRAQAEAENTRRRSARDVENAHKFALERFTADLLPVIDSFERAVEAAGEGEAAAETNIVEGLELSLKLLFDVLEKSGIEILDPLGEPFDPQVHEAMTVVENPDAEPGSVIQVVQKGYVLNGRVVRAAMVMVAKETAE